MLKKIVKEDKLKEENFRVGATKVRLLKLF